MEENSFLLGAYREWKGSFLSGETALLTRTGRALLSDVTRWQSALAGLFPCLSLPGNTGARFHSWHGAEQPGRVIKVAEEIFALFRLLF